MRKDDMDLENLIVSKKKIHIFGEPGVGKSYIVKRLAEKNSLRLFISYARSEEDLVRDFGDFPFQKGNNIFLLEGDSYYWKRYGLVKKYITESKSTFIVITNAKSKPTKNITKHLKQVKVYPPTKEHVAQWLNEFSDVEQDLNAVYDKDWRVIKRNTIYGKRDENALEKDEKIKSREVVYKLLKGTATKKDLENCSQPLSFVLNSLGWNTPNFYEGEELSKNMELISFIDANKYSLNKKYLENYLMEFIPSYVKRDLYFPPYKRIKDVKVEEPSYEVSKFTKKKVKAEVSTTAQEIGDFLLI